MGLLWSFLINLAVAILATVVSLLLFPPVTPKTTKPEVGELGAPTTDEGGCIPYFWGTRILPVNCVWWTPTGNREIKK